MLLSSTIQFSFAIYIYFSWLAKLTPDYFLNMDVDAFKEMITLWLEDKYARMERYSSYGPEEPIHK